MGQEAEKRDKMKSFEQIALDKLCEIEPATLKAWALAVGYPHTDSFRRTLNTLRKSGSIIEDKKHKPYIYRIRGVLN